LAVREGRFRQDLFYRVNVINIDLPPLRDRIEDIPVLARQFLQSVCEESGKNVVDISPDAMCILQKYSWPGNVRELQNVISRGVLLGGSDVITARDLPPNLTDEVPISVATATGKSLKEALEGPERQIILDVLKSNDWNRNATADALGINRTTLYKKMKRLGLDDAESGFAPALRTNLPAPAPMPPVNHLS
jgi:DNA-binding NtrC family response regulator